jgi:uncharacterized protein YigE (DUF2233 family)
MKRLGCGTIALIGTAILFFSAPAECGEWSKLGDGLLLGEFAPSQKSPVADYPVTVLRIDPVRYAFRLLSALEHGGRVRTTRAWCEEFGLLAAINAGMYRSDLRSTGYMRNDHHVNNPSFNPAFGAFILFNPKDPALPPVKWLDSRRDKEWQNELKQYDSVVQNYRMISSGRKVKWREQDKTHSTAALGMDGAGHVLFILSRAPYTPQEFIDLLLSLPIQIRDAMYLEGGDEASLTLRHRENWVEWAGIDDLGIFSSQGPPRIPNVIGIIKRK